MSDSETPRAAAHQASLSFTTSWGLLSFTSVEPVMLSNLLILCHPLLLLPSIRVFSNESALCSRRPKYWSFNISPSDEYPGLISFAIDWLDLLAIRGTLESPLAPQFESVSSSVLRLLHGPALTSTHNYWKNHSFNFQQVMSLLSYMLSRFVIAFLPRSKSLF